MIRSCSFGALMNNSACDNFIENGGEKVFTPSVGVCYVFNFGTNGLNLKAESADSSGGLKLEIDIECNIFKYIFLATIIFFLLHSINSIHYWD